MSQTFKLYRLQQLDLQLDKALSRVNEIDAILNDNRKLQQAQDDLDLAASKLEEAGKQLRKAEGDVQAQNLKIEQTETTLYSGKVQNPKELQDLQNETLALKRYLDVLEERLLEAMLVEEEAETQYQSAVRYLKDLEVKVNLDHGNLNAEKGTLLKKIARLQDEKQLIARSIPQDHLKLYESLRKQRGGIAVAKVADKSCSACGSMLSTSLLYSARSPNKITRCATCNRILYAG